MKTRRPLKERNVVFRLTEDEVRRIDHIAEREQRSRSQLLSRFVREGLMKEEPATLTSESIKVA